MSDALGIIVAIAAALGAVGYLVRLVRKGVRTWDRIEALMRPTAEHVDRELTGNHGSSMKDQLDGLPHVVEVLRRDVQRVGEQVAVAVETAQATSQQLDDHITQSDLDRQRLADQGIDLTGGNDT